MKDRYGRIFIGDVITKVADKKITSKDDIFHELEKYKIGDRIEIVYYREGKKKKTTIKLQQL